jgi:hypothetical protein
MPNADTALSVSDWREAKALLTIACSYLMLRPTLARSPEVFAKAVDLPTPYEKCGDVRFQAMQHTRIDRGTNRRSNALNRSTAANSSNESGGLPALSGNVLITN